MKVRAMEKISKLMALEAEKASLVNNITADDVASTPGDGKHEEEDRDKDDWEQLSFLGHMRKEDNLDALDHYKDKAVSGKVLPPVENLFKQDQTKTVLDSKKRWLKKSDLKQMKHDSEQFQEKWKRDMEAIKANANNTDALNISNASGIGSGSGSSAVENMAALMVDVEKKAMESDSDAAKGSADGSGSGSRESSDESAAATDEDDEEAETTAPTTAPTPSPTQNLETQVKQVKDSVLEKSDPKDEDAVESDADDAAKEADSVDKLVSDMDKKTEAKMPTKKKSPAAVRR